MVSNPVYPMPGMRETIDSIRGKGLNLGIISNAQFYTPIILAAFCQTGIEELGFDRSLTFFSYCFGKGKPDLFLYEYAVLAIAEMGFQPEQVLYVGNDMTKDMVPAKTVGFKTGLFAGDQRSLRLGQHTLPLTTTVDLILTELTQIDECISNRN
jgi:putative hydrolase of the HAD superfamily